MDRLKKHFSSDVAIIIYTYIMTIIVVILSYVITIMNANSPSNNTKINFLFSFFKDGAVILSWCAVALFLIVSIAITISWIKERNKNK